MTDKENMIPKIDKQIAKKADEFAEREYETDGYERQWLSKGYYHGYKDASKNKSEEPVSEDLEEAAEEARKRMRPLFESIKESTGEPVSAYDQYDMIEIFKAGAQWQKLKIIYKAIIYNDKIYPTTYENEPTEFCLDGGEEVRLITEAVNNGLLKQGDKVKVIIIKEESV